MVAEKYATLPVPSSTTFCGSLKLMSLEEAQARSLGASHPARQRENSLPDTRTAATLYHTVIDLNDNKYVVHTNIVIIMIIIIISSIIIIINTLTLSLSL